MTNLTYRMEYTFAIFSMLAVMYNHINLNDISFCNNYANCLLMIISLVIFFSFYKYMLSIINEFSILSISIAVFAGIINVLGHNFLLYDSLAFGDTVKKLPILFSVAAAIGYGVLHATLFEWGWQYLDGIKKAATDISRNICAFSYIVFDKHSFRYPFFIICFFWLPYLVAFYPGIVHWDAAYALTKYYGFYEWDFHYPVIGVLLMGYTMDIGKYLGSNNFGCTIYVLLQFLFFSMTVSYIFVIYKEWQTPYTFRWITVLVFSLLPIFPMTVVNEVKDTFYFIAVLWLLYSFIFALSTCDKKTLFINTTAVIFTCCLRKEGIIICIFCIIALVFFRNAIHKWKDLFISVTLGICLGSLITNVAGTYYNVKPASIREALSLPVQQTARYIRDHAQDISINEWKVLNTVFENKAEKLGKFYNPDRSDEVKFKMIHTLSKQQMYDYFKVWSIHFFRHPMCYFAATFNQMYGYFYIGKPEFYYYGYKGIGGYYTENLKEGQYNLSPRDLLVTDYPSTINMRNAIKKYMHFMEYQSFFGLLFRPATYTWLLFFALTSLIHNKKYKYLFLFCIPLTILIICCLSPLNASIRYSFPIMIMSFLLMAYSLKTIQEQKNVTEDK